MRTLSIQFIFNFLICFLFCIPIAQAQTKSTTDSLESIYLTKKQTLDKLKMLNALSESTKNTNYQLFIEKKLADLKTTLKTTADSAFYYSVLGNLPIAKSDKSQALNNLKKSLLLFEKSKDYHELAGELSSQIAHLYFLDGIRDSSLFYYKNSIDIYKSNRLTNNLPLAYYDYALEKYFASNIVEAVENCYNSIKIGIIQKKYSNVALSYNLLSRISRDQKNGMKFTYIDSALVYAFKSKNKITLTDVYFKLGEYYIDDNEFDKGMDIAHKIEALYKQEPNNVQLETRYYEFLSRYYDEKGDYSNCIKYYKKTIRNFINNNYYKGQTGWAYNNLGDVCIKAERYEDAIFYLDSSNSYATSLNDLHLSWYANYNLIYAYQGLKDYKTALDYFWKYDSINNIILTKENGEKISELQTKYDVERKENQIKLLNKDNELNKENIEKQHLRILFLSIIIGIVLLLVVIIIFAYNTKRKANILLAKQKQEIIDKTEQLNKQAADIAMYKAQMNPHFLFNAINSVQQFVLEKQTSLALEYLSDLSKLMRSTLNFSDKEFISIKDELDYLQQYIRFEKLRCDNKFEFHVSIGNEIDAENTCVLPMLIQPFIENAVKHGIIPKTGKGNISLKFEKTTISTNEFLKITIEDDGVGRAVAQTTKQNLVVKHQSKGMEITENRVLKLNEKHFSEAIQGIKIIDKFVDDKSLGTTIELYIPFIELF